MHAGLDRGQRPHDIGFSGELECQQSCLMLQSQSQNTAQARRVCRLKGALHLEGGVLADAEGVRGVAGDGLLAVDVLGTLHHR